MSSILAAITKTKHLRINVQMYWLVGLILILSIISPLVTPVIAYNKTQLHKNTISINKDKSLFGSLDNAANRLKLILFGNIWNYNEYCGYKYSNDELLSRDSRAERFFNGTLLYQYDEFQSVAQMTSHIGDLNHLGVELQQSISGCNALSSNYANEFDQLNSLSPQANSSQCKLDIAELHSFVATLRIGRHGSETDNNRIETTNDDPNHCPVPLTASACSVSLSPTGDTNLHIQATSRQHQSHHLDSQTKLSATSPFKLWRQLASNARAPAGPQFAYQTIWLGDYDECVSPSSGISGRYCFALLRMNSWLKLEHLKSISGNAYKVGVCLPRTCDAIHVQEDELLARKIEHIVVSSLGADNGACTTPSYRLSGLYCLPDRDSKLVQISEQVRSSPLSIALLAFLFIWMLLIAYSTWICNFAKNIQPSKLLVSFNLISNICRFLEIPEAIQTQKNTDISNINQISQKGKSKPENELSLNFIKVFALLWLIDTHTHHLMTSYYAKPLEFSSMFDQSAYGSVVINGQHAVNAFFIVSGFLVGRKLFRYMKSSTTLAPNWTAIIFNRYMRLAPLYLIVYALNRQFGTLLSSGPLWDYGVASESEMRQCKSESWFVPILMLANFIYPFSHCIITGWHIANDFQIYLLLPLFFIAYKKSIQFGDRLAVLAFIITQTSHIINWLFAPNVNIRQVLMYPQVFGFRVILDRLVSDYVNPLGRLGTYMLGVYLASLVTNRQEIELKPTNNDSNKKKREVDKNNVDINFDNEQTTNFNTRTQLSLWLGLSLIFGTIWLTIFPRKMKAIFLCNEQLGKGLAYTTARVAVEVGWFFVIIKLIKLSEFSKYIETLQDKLSILNSQSRITTDTNSESTIVVPVGICNSITSSYKRNIKSSIESDELVHYELRLKQSLDETPMATLWLNINKFIELPLWQLLVKLNYCLILTHYSIAKQIVLSRRTLIPVTWTEHFQTILLVILVSYMVAFVFHIIIEMPLNEIVNRKLKMHETRKQQIGGNKCNPANNTYSNRFTTTMESFEMASKHQRH